MVDLLTFSVLAILIIVIVFVLFARSIHTVQPYQQGVAVLFGSFKGVLNPGVHILHPLVRVHAVDLRPKTFEFSVADATSPDGMPYRLDLRVIVRVADARRSVFFQPQFEAATTQRAGREIRALVSTLPPSEVNLQREPLSARLKAALEPTLAEWGLAIDDVELLRDSQGAPAQGSSPPVPVAR